MRRMLMVAASAALVSLFDVAGASAATLAGPAMRTTAESLGLVQPARRVCREVCREGFCRQRCWDEPEYRERRVYREYDDDDPPPRVYYERPRQYDPAPGVGIYGPGFGIGVGAW